MQLSIGQTLRRSRRRRFSTKRKGLAEPNYNQTNLNASQSLKLQTDATLLNQTFNCYTQNRPTNASSTSMADGSFDEAATSSPATPTSAVQLYPNITEFDYNFEPYSVESSTCSSSGDVDRQLFGSHVKHMKSESNITRRTLSTEASPLGLHAADAAEQSFIFESTPCGAIMPIKCSQDYDDEGVSIFDEINQISKCGFYYTNNNNCSQTSVKTEFDAVPSIYDLQATLSQGTAISVTGEALKIYQDEDSCLATVDRFSDVMINGFVTPTTTTFNNNFIQINGNLDNGDVDYCMLTPAPSPKSADGIIDAIGKQLLTTIQHCDEAQTSFTTKSDRIGVDKRLQDVQHEGDEPEKSDEANAGQEQRLLIEHNYNINAKVHVLNINNSQNINNNHHIRKIGKHNNNTLANTPNCKRKLVMSTTEETENTNNKINNTALTTSSAKLSKQQEKLSTMRRVPPLKIKLTPAAMLKEEPVTAVSTPDIANDILEMEDCKFDEFDLVQYINSSQLNSVPCVEDEDIKSVMSTEAAAMVIQPKQPSIEYVVQMLTTPSGSNHLTTFSTPNPSCYASTDSTPVSRKRQRLDSYDNPSSVQSVTSTLESDDDASMPASSSTPSTPASSSAAPKRRGRPPKTTPTPLSPSQLRHMNESDLRYFQMRNKNNEASRRSRINRKDREQQIEDEAQGLESRYADLQEKERALERDCKKWKEAVMKLACR